MTEMRNTIIAFAAWHPEKGFDAHAYEGPVAYADLCRSLLSDVADLNETDGTDTRKGWRAVKVEIKRLT